MGMLDRFADIVKANINDLLDKCEDPAKMIDQYLRDLTENLAEVKKETAGVMAEEARTQAHGGGERGRDRDAYDGLARKALAGRQRRGRARRFWPRSSSWTAQGRRACTATYDAAHENASKMRQMHDKLVERHRDAERPPRGRSRPRWPSPSTQQKVNELRRRGRQGRRRDERVRPHGGQGRRHAGPRQPPWPS